MSIYDGEQYFKWSGCSEFSKRASYFDFMAATLISNFHIQSALDIGCGGGDLIYAFRKQGIAAYGLDVSGYALHHSLNESKGYLLQTDMDSSDLPFKANSFDLVTATELVEHLRNIDHFFSEVNRVLRKSGALFITTPQPILDIVVSMARGRIRENTHVNVHSHSFWLKEVHEQGFRHVGSLKTVASKFPTRFQFLLKPPFNYLYSKFRAYSTQTFLFIKL